MDTTIAVISGAISLAVLLGLLFGLYVLCVVVRDVLTMQVQPLEGDESIGRPRAHHRDGPGEAP